jgi:hypothetical protein
VIAGRDEVHARLEHLFGGLRGQPEAGRGVFTVGDTGVNLMLLANERDAALERVAAR